MSRFIEIKKGIGWRYIGKEIVVFNCRNQKIVVWNKTATHLWYMISRGVNFNQLVNWLVNEYSIGLEQAQGDTLNFLQEAVSMDLIDFSFPKIKSICKRDFSDDKDGENTLSEIEMSAIKHLVPFAITFETTYNCNEKCVHCYMDKNIPALSLHEIKKILNEIANEGCLFVSFTGGEFFTRSDSLEIIRYASDLRFIIDILSNGTLINKEIAESLSVNNVRRVQISLYGATSETHDSITRLKNSFQKTIKGIKSLRSNGVKVEIAFLMMRQNFHERYIVRDLAKSLDCLFLPSYIVTARNNGSRDTHSLRLTDRQLQEFLEDKTLSDLYVGRKPFETHQLYFRFSNLLNAAPCYSGFNTCAITPQGKILPCNQLLYESGDLKQDNFSKIWHNSPQLRYLRNLKISGLKQCANCKLLSSCARCPGLALLENNDLLGISPENCRTTNILKNLKDKGGKR